MTGDMDGFTSEIIDWIVRLPEGTSWRPVRIPLVRVRHVETNTVVTVGITECELLNRSYGIARICEHLRTRNWLAAS